MLRRSLLATTVLASLASLPLSGGARAADVPAGTPPTLAQRLEAALSDPSSTLRYVANECVLTAVAAVTVSAIFPVSAGPMASVAFGVIPGVPLAGIAVAGCGAGMAGGLTSVAISRAWDDRAYIQEVVVAQAAYAVEAGAGVASAVVAAVADPAGTVTTVAAGVLQQGQSAIGAVASAAYAMAGWWQPPPSVDEDSIDIAGVPDGPFFGPGPVTY